MATRNIIPRGDGEGNLGSAIKRWIKGWFVDVYVSGSITDGTDSVTVNQLANPPGGGDLLSANNLSDVADAATSLSNLSGEPAFSKNTAFNKNFGTIAGTVLEGDTVIPTTVFTPTINSTNMVEVSQESDFGTAVAGVINFQLSNLKFSSTNSTGGDVVLRAVNYNAPDYNAGRDKVLTLVNCQFRNCFDVWNIEGFDLCDIQNTLVWYIEATTIGCQFKNVSKLQLSSCEFVRWFDETTIPTPSGWATTSMIELLADGGGSGFGAVNINGGIIHPQQTQVGIDIDTASTTGFGTISSNAFINVGLTTGKVFLPEIPVLLLPDYSQTATVKFDVFANQGVLNSTSGVVMTVSNNVTDTALSTGVPSVINTGALALNRAAVRYDVTTGGRATYTGTKQVYVSIHGTISYQKQGGGTDAYIFYIYKNGVLLAGSNFDVTSGGATADGVAALNYGTLMNQNDYIEIYVENPGSNDNILIKDLQLVIRE